MIYYMSGEVSIKEKEELLKKNSIEKIKKSSIFKKVLDSFPDADLIDIEFKGPEND